MRLSHRGCRRGWRWNRLCLRCALGSAAVLPHRRAGGESPRRSERCRSRSGGVPQAGSWRERMSCHMPRPTRLESAEGRGIRACRGPSVFPQQHLGERIGDGARPRLPQPKPRRNEDAWRQATESAAHGRDFDCQVAELQIRIAVLNRYTAIGIPVTEAVKYVRPGERDVPLS